MRLCKTCYFDRKAQTFYATLILGFMMYDCRGSCDAENQTKTSDSNVDGCSSSECPLNSTKDDASDDGMFHQCFDL